MFPDTTNRLALVQKVKELDDYRLLATNPVVNAAAGYRAVATTAEPPKPDQIIQWSSAQAAAFEQLQSVNNEEAGEKLRGSFAGGLGRAIEPLIAPLGFDWKMGIGIVASFAAREVFVGTMSIIYNVGKYDHSEQSMKNLQKIVQQQLRPDGSRVYTPLTAVTLMVFYVFALQCVSTVAVVRRETNSWKWPLFPVGLHGRAGVGPGICHVANRPSIGLGLTRIVREKTKNTSVN